MAFLQELSICLFAYKNGDRGGVNEEGNRWESEEGTGGEEEGKTLVSM